MKEKVNVTGVPEKMCIRDRSSDGMEQMVDYIYDHYDNFRLLLKCGDSGKFELFIHNMVDREMKSSLKYMEKMKEAGVKIPVVEESLMPVSYTHLVQKTVLKKLLRLLLQQ